MANRYWVGGSGTWNTTNTTNWATSSGGASGASVPTSIDAVFFDAASGGGTCTFGVPVSCLTFTITGYAGTFASAGNELSVTGNSGTIYSSNATHTLSGDLTINFTYAGGVGTRTISAGNTTEANSANFKISAGTDTVGGIVAAKTVDFSGFSGTYGFTSTRTWYGSVVFSPTMTLSAATAVLVLASTNASARTIACNGKTLDFPVTINGAGGTFNFADSFSLGTTRALTLTNGTLNGNNQAVSIGTFALGAGTKTLTLGSGTWTVAGTSWNANTNVANLTVSASTGIINMTSASAKTFAGGAKTWPTLNQGGSGALTIQQSNTFANITNTVQPATITFTANTTTTVSAFGASGISGNLVTLNSSTAGTRATLSDPSGVISVSFCSIKDLSATGGAVWASYVSNGNVDAGNNAGWDFGVAPSAGDPIYNYRIRPFTQPRRF